MTLQDLLKSLSEYELFEDKYYNFEDFRKQIELKQSFSISSKGILIAPFYIIKKGIIELYDYDLQINVVENPKIDKYLLTRTGKRNISEIDPFIYNKLKSCYIEIIKPETEISTERLLEYINLIMNAEDVLERIKYHNINQEKQSFYFQVTLD